MAEPSNCRHIIPKAVSYPQSPYQCFGKNWVGVGWVDEGGGGRGKRGERGKREAAACT